MLEPTLVVAFGFGTLVAFAVLSVLLILNCGWCGSGGEYEALLDKRPLSTQPLTTKHQILTAAKKQWEKEDVVENVLYFVRSLPDCKLHPDHNLWAMSWRDTRANFLVDYKGKTNLLTIVKMGDACPLPWNKQGKDALLTTLRELKHPFVQICSEADILFDDKQIVTLTLFGNKGSLRDEIYSCEPTKEWEKKYNPKNGRKLSTPTIAKYGRQILEALLFLEKSGFPYTHLHTGNVIVKNGVARITQLENGLLNLERQHERLFRQFYKQSPKKFAENSLNVISFGTVLYEMAVGKVLENLSQIAEYPSSSCPQAKQILESIFNEGDSFKTPTIESLADHDFFKVVWNKQIQQILKKVNEATSQLFGVFKPAPKVKKPRRAPGTPTRSGATSPTTSTPTSPRASTQAPAPAAQVRSTTTTTTPPAARTAAPAPAPTQTRAGPPPPSGGPPPPAGGPRPPTGGPPPPAGGPPAPAPQPGRSSLLSSIEGFKGGLKKVKTVDKSAPTAGRVLG